MSWRAAAGREPDQCNRCREIPDMGAPLYVGEVAKASWCCLCALEVFGKRPDQPNLEPVRELSPLAKADAALAQGFEALRAKAKIKWIGDRPMRNSTGWDDDTERF